MEKKSLRLFFFVPDLLLKLRLAHFLSKKRIRICRILVPPLVNGKVNACALLFFIPKTLTKTKFGTLSIPKTYQDLQNPKQPFAANGKEKLAPFLFCSRSLTKTTFLTISETKKVICLSKSLFRLVGMTGFEPATTRPPAVYATRLRHIPELSVQK